MADKIPVKAYFAGADVVALGEFEPGDTVPVDQGGTGVTTIAAILAALGLTDREQQTGDFKTAMRVSIPAGWVAANGGTIGSGSSGATNRADADTEDLFTLWWTEFTDGELPVFTSGGGASTRGASAAADFAADKRMTVPDFRERYIRVAGATNSPGDLLSESIADHAHRTPFGWDASNYFAWGDGSDLPVFGSDVEGSVSRSLFGKSASGTGAGRFARTSADSTVFTGETRPATATLSGFFKL